MIETEIGLFFLTRQGTFVLAVFDPECGVWLCHDVEWRVNPWQVTFSDLELFKAHSKKVLERLEAR